MNNKITTIACMDTYQTMLCQESIADCPQRHWELMAKKSKGKNVIVGYNSVRYFEDHHPEILKQACSVIVVVDSSLCYCKEYSKLRDKYILMSKEAFVDKDRLNAFLNLENKKSKEFFVIGGSSVIRSAIKSSSTILITVLSKELKPNMKHYFGKELRGLTWALLEKHPHYVINKLTKATP